MAYFLLKIIFRIALKVFYTRIDVSGKVHIPNAGPLLIVANHPNTFMDPVIIASLVKQEVNFIAKSTVFNSPFRKWLLQKMNLIPVYRKEDGPVNPGVNDTTFQKCFEFLKEAGTVLIFPEGNSFNQRRLRPLKTGAARIALGTAAQSNFTQEISVLPIGLNYSDPTRFRSNVLVNIGPAIRVSTYEAIFREDEREAYKQLTNHIRIALETQIIHTHSDEDDELIHQVEAIYKYKLVTDIKKEASDPEEEFQLTRRIVASLEYFKNRNPEKVTYIQKRLKNYLAALKDLKVSEKLMRYPFKSWSAGGWVVWTTVYLIIGLPFYLFGLITNYIPYILPARVADALTEEEEFIAPILMTVGIFTFPLFYALEIYLIWYITKNIILVVCFMISLPLLGFYVLHYYQYLKTYAAKLRLKSLLQKKRVVIDNLCRQREELIEELELAREQYLQEIESN